MQISSPVISDGEKIPPRFTCDGANLSPRLLVENVPADTKSLSLIVDDPDAPNGTFTHWIVWNIDPEIDEIPEGNKPDDSIEGVNSSGSIGYVAPCPPNGTHHYHFKLFALDSDVNLTADSNVEDLETEMSDHIIEKTEFVGLYSRI